VYDAIAFPLKLMVAKYSVLALRMLNIPVMREGNIIIFPSITLEVADACSGIRSLMSLLALSTAYAMYLSVSTWKKSVIVLMAIPIAIFANWLRVFVTGVLAQNWGAKAAEGFFHEFAGLAVFALAMMLLFLVGAVMRRGEK
jgi:exosortase